MQAADTGPLYKPNSCRCCCCRYCRCCCQHSAFVCLLTRRRELLLLLSLLCQFHFGNSLLHLTTNSIENLSRHSTSDERRQRRQGRRVTGGRGVLSKSIANLKTNLPQRNSKRKRRSKWEVKGSTAKLSQRKLRFNSFEFVSLSLSLPPSLSLSACLFLTLTLSCRWSSVNVRLNVTLRMRHVVRCTSTWHNWQRLAHSSVPPAVPLSVCLSVHLAPSLSGQLLPGCRQLFA